MRPHGLRYLCEASIEMRNQFIESDDFPLDPVTPN